jgi:3-oxoacyl-[acyl-carrier protein] reductase
LCAELLHAGAASCAWISVDMTQDDAVRQFAGQLNARSLALDGAVLMPPQEPPSSDPLPGSERWREMFQNSFIGPLALLKAAIERMQPDAASGRRCKIVIISGISSAQVMGQYASSNVLRCAWLAQAKTLAFALGERGIHVNTLSLGGTLTPGYAASLEKRAVGAGVTFGQRLAEETANVPLRKYGTPEEVAVAVEGLLSGFSDHMTGLNILHDGGFTRAY